MRRSDLPPDYLIEAIVRHVNAVLSFPHESNRYKNAERLLKINNRVDNLEWCTVQYNSVYGSARYKISFQGQKIIQKIAKKQS